ncbi:PREDICTED: alpha-1-inhibitor 3-like [Priapulus caudatus]|uniref:Alpha-1-inhibitor 3-like n=1 Tax=Priapulus caudatus TaxID=37621 RepID=A0ABM1EIZ9_PRICU|nr:PREDICTED: alpha-1-inhibitor 3-like [Priapulus caudatus]
MYGNFNQGRLSQLPPGQQSASTLKRTNDVTVPDVIASTHLYNQDVNGASLCADLDIPDTKASTAYLLFRADETSYFHIADQKQVFLRRPSFTPVTFIEPDKPVYKPGQKVQSVSQPIIRSYANNEPINKVWIKDPSGTRIAQWLDVATDGGIASLDLNLSEEPPLGTWEIVVTTEDGVTNKQFQVLEYVLPKYEVTVGPSSKTIARTLRRVSATICARYTYGKPVDGDAVLSVCLGWTNGPSSFGQQFDRAPKPTPPSCVHTRPLGLQDGCREFDVDIHQLTITGLDLRSYPSWFTAEMTFSANVTEDDTDVTLSGEETAAVVEDTLNLEIRGSDYFRAPIPYIAEVVATKFDGTRAGGLLIELSGIQHRQVRATGPDGTARFIVNIDQGTEGVNLQLDLVVLQVVATKFDGTRAGGLLIELSGIQHRQVRTTGPDGTARFIVNIDQGTESVNLQARPVDDTKGIEGNKHIRGWFSTTNQYVQIEAPSGVMRCGEKGSVTVTYTVDKPGTQQFYYKVIGKNKILSVGTTEHTVTAEQFASDQAPGASSTTNLFALLKKAQRQLGGRQKVVSFDLELDITHEMAPNVKLLVFRVAAERGRGAAKEIIADSRQIDIEKCLRNKVSISFDEREQTPGSGATLQIRASPRSLCAVGVVDKSVTLLADSNPITAASVFEKLGNSVRIDQTFYSISDYCRSKHGEPGPPSTPPPPPPIPLDDDKRCRYVWANTEYVDSRLAFQDLGLLVMTDMNVDARPCKSEGLEHFPIFFQRGGPGPFAFGGGGANVLDDVDIEPQAAPSTPDVRTFFPETWLWSLERVDDSGELLVRTEVPDTITDWVGGGFCTSEETGLGISPPLALRAFQPFFVSYTLPYSVIRGEKVPLIVSVFNYLSDCLAISLTLDESMAFDIIDENEAEICVCGGQSTTHRFMIEPRELGDVNITVHAMTADSGGAICRAGAVMSTVTGVRDAITQPLLVEAEGVEKSYSINWFVCPEDGEPFSDTMDLVLPSESLVPDSGRARVSVIGDVMGAPLENLDELLTMPHGCGEQNMITFAPDIYIMEYLTATDQVTPEIEDKAVGYMKSGYQRS